MPTYEYRCRACGHEFEQFQSITAPAVRTCPACKKRKVEKKLSVGGAVLFKGGGFYETDYRSEAYRKAADADTKSTETAKSEARDTKDAPSDAAKSATPAAKSNESPKEDSRSTGATGPSQAKGRASTPAPTEHKASAPADSRRPAQGRSHAREGRGIGNIIQAGKARASRSKRRTR